MPTVTLNKKVLEELAGKKLPIDQLKDRISMLGTDLESIEGDEIHVEIFPNRPDMLSEQGFARAFSSFIGVRTGLRKYNVKKSGYQLFVKNTPDYYPYAIAFIAKNFNLDQEKVRQLIQLQEKLGVTMLRNRRKGGIGLYPLEKLNFPITFEGRDPKQISFRPLEYLDILSATEILEKHKKGKEYGHLMKDWDTYTIFVDSKGTIMSMPPIINSHDVGKIDETTKNIFVECTGKDLNIITKAMNIVAASLIDMGADVQSIEVHHHNKTWDVPNLNPSKVKLDKEYLNKRLGLSVSEKQVKILLERMGYGYEKGSVLVPAYRADILHHADFAEDIAIAYGYENFPATLPSISTIGEEDPLEKFLNKIREILIGVPLIEVKNYHLMMFDELVTRMNTKDTPVPLKNAIGDYNHLRQTILPSILKNLQENQHNEYPQNIFEVGRIFLSDQKSETGVKEQEHLSIILCHEKADFTEIRQALDILCRSLDLPYKVKEIDHPSFVTGRVGCIFIKKEVVGCLGEIHPQVLTNWNLSMPTVALELNIERIFELCGEKYTQKQNGEKQQRL